MLAARTHLPRNIPCDSVAYAEGVQKRNPFLFLSFSYFSDRRKVPLILHVLLHDQKYQKSSKPFPLRNLPVIFRPAKARTICTLLCEHIEQTVRPQAKAEVQAQMYGLSARLCSVPCRYGRRSCVLALSAHRLRTRPPHLYMRAWIFAYANLLGSFV